MALEHGHTDYHGTYIVVESCCRCGVLFGLNDAHKKQLLDNGNSFYCPNGHSQYFTDSSKIKIQKLKQEILIQKEILADRQKALEAERRSSASYKGQITRIKRRVKNGVCPCCKRSFINLERHMKHMHKEFGA